MFAARLSIKLANRGHVIRKQNFDLQGCSALTDEGLAAVAAMTGLATVNLQDCLQLKGTGFATWAHMPTLTSLSLQNACRQVSNPIAGVPSPDPRPSPTPSRACQSLPKTP